MEMFYAIARIISRYVCQHYRFDKLILTYLDNDEESASESESTRWRISCCDIDNAYTYRDTFTAYSRSVTKLDTKEPLAISGAADWRATWQDLEDTESIM
ncbi:hypothetical protein HN011_002281 [Eciton burchellii]|nr:hypothetical protein HN011_002281 [Eciton burchellii]